jgi:hypothetical protein
MKLPDRDTTIILVSITIVGILECLFPQVAFTISVTLFSFMLLLVGVVAFAKLVDMSIKSLLSLFSNKIEVTLDLGDNYATES